MNTVMLEFCDFWGVVVTDNGIVKPGYGYAILMLCTIHAGQLSLSIPP